MRSPVKNLPAAILFLTLAFSSNQAFAEGGKNHPADWHCLTDHVEEALKLNEERKSLYSALSKDSVPVSEALIAMEHQILLGLKPVMPILESYWDRGVPVLCKGFVPMAETPSFSETFATPLPAGDPQFASPYEIAYRLFAAQVKGGRDGLIEAGRKEILDLDKADHYQCLMKHMLESIVYAAEVIPEIKQAGLDKGSNLPNAWISWISIQSQITMLTTASNIDKLAEKAHRQGLPIICNDVPVILKDLQ